MSRFAIIFRALFFLVCFPRAVFALEAPLMDDVQRRPSGGDRMNLECGVSPAYGATEKQEQGSGTEERLFDTGADSLTRPSQSFMSAVGHIHQSTDPHKICFGTKDLVYIKIKPSARNWLQVGDRYTLRAENCFSGQKSDSSHLPSVHFESAGMVEIICVGEDTALGIILKANTSIVQGVSVCRVRRGTPSQLTHDTSTSKYFDQLSSF